MKRFKRLAIGLVIGTNLLTGEEGSGHADLLISREGRFWVIRRIERSPNLLGF